MKKLVIILMLLLPLTACDNNTFEDGTYDGDFIKGLRDGLGSMTYNNGDTYDGYWNDDKRVGYGKMIYSNGDVYVGEWGNDEKKYGEMRYINGDTYIGEWSENNYNGKGMLTYENGDVYEGSFDNGSMVGTGTYTYANGDTYVGSFLNNLFSGNGKFVWKNGSVYEGRFEKGVMQGIGYYTFANGDVHEGLFNNDIPNGHGIRYFVNGEILETEFINWNNAFTGIYRNSSGESLNKKLVDGEILNGTDVFWNSKAKRFAWEKDGVIVIGVDNDEMGAQLIKKWNDDFPELSGRLVFIDYDSYNGYESGVEGIVSNPVKAPDVALVIDNQVVGNSHSLLQLNDYFIKTIEENAITSITDSINEESVVYITAFYDGMVFSWNKTLFEEMGLDITDDNGDNLPDAYDTWEEIFTLKVDSLPVINNRKILEVYPIALDSYVNNFYSLLTAGGFEMFASGKYDDPGFENEEFLEGLEFVKTFSGQGLNVDYYGIKKEATRMNERWEFYLLDESYLFSLVENNINLHSAMEYINSDFKFSQIPTWQGNQLSPLMRTRGFVINGSTEYPSAASEVLRWLYTEETMAEMISISSYIPALQQDGSAYPTEINEYLTEFSLAIKNNQSEPISRAKNRFPVEASWVYDLIDVSSYLKDIWDGNITPKEAQDAIVASYNQIYCSKSYNNC